jgi:hypothetical protein
VFGICWMFIKYLLNEWLNQTIWSDVSGEEGADIMPSYRTENWD